MQKNRTYIRFPDSLIARFTDCAIESFCKNTVRYRGKHCVTAYNNHVGEVVRTRARHKVQPAAAKKVIITRRRGNNPPSTICV